MADHANKAVLFDIDDTLAPTSHFINIVLNESVRKMADEGLKVDRIEHAVETLKQIRMSSHELGIDFNLLCFNYGVSNGDISRIVQAGIEEYHRIRDVLLKPNPYARELLWHLASAGYLLGVCSNGNPEKQRDKLRYIKLEDYLGQYFYASDDPAVRKPHPNMLLDALKDMDADASRSFYVGDRPEDMLAAHSAGMKGIRYIHGHHSGRSSVSVLLGQGISGENILSGLHNYMIKQLTPDYEVSELIKIKEFVV